MDQNISVSERAKMAGHSQLARGHAFDSDPCPILQPIHWTLCGIPVIQPRFSSRTGSEAKHNLSEGSRRWETQPRASGTRGNPGPFEVSGSLDVISSQFMEQPSCLCPGSCIVYRVFPSTPHSHTNATSLKSVWLCFPDWHLPRALSLL